MDAGDPRDLIDVVTILWRAGCIAFLVYELLLVMRRPPREQGRDPVGQRDASDKANDRTAPAHPDSTGNETPAAPEDTTSAKDTAPSADTTSSTEVSWRSTMGEELIAGMSALVTMLAALAMLMALDISRDGWAEFLVDLGIAVLVVVVILHPKHYRITGSGLFLRGTGFSPEQFSGFSVDGAQSSLRDKSRDMRILTLESAARRVFGMSVAGRRCILVFSCHGEHGAICDSVEDLLRKFYNQNVNGPLDLEA